MKKALIIIDCQQDFISGALGFPEAGQIVAQIADKADRDDWTDIWLTLDTHDGIGVVDVKDLLPDEEIDRTKEDIFKFGFHHDLFPLDRTAEKKSFAAGKSPL